MKAIPALLLPIACVAAAAQVQRIEPKETPPLQPLHWCKHADGQTRAQVEACGPGTTAGTSTSTVTYGQAGQQDPIPASVSAAAGTDAQQGAWQVWGKWATLAVLALMVLQWLRRRPV